jgi:hypothetical protein
MNFSSLSLKQSPDISIPLRFILTAPLFAIIATLIWLYTGPELAHNRWLPSMLATTHLFTLGFITMIMMGALFQLLPVISGRGIFAAHYSSLLIYILFTMGVSLLAYGFYNSHAEILRLALILLGTSFGIFLPLLTHALFSIAASNDAVRSLRAAVLSLWVAIGFGIWLLSGHSGITPLMRSNTPLHIAWAAVGWVNIVVISVAYQVIPMFQVTHEYPRIISRWLTPGIFLLLILWSLSHIWLQQQWLYFLLALLICLLLLAFIGMTLHLQIQRKKVRADANLYFWFAGLIQLFLCMLLYMYAQVVNTDLDTETGMVFILGFVVPIINGMLYKIVPFLVWLHLNQKLAFSKNRIKIPTMHDIISHRRGMLQLYIYLLAVMLTLLSFIKADWFFAAAGVAWLINFSLFWMNLLGAVITYSRIKNKFS